jgi:hypothetical protein
MSKLMEDNKVQAILVPYLRSTYNTITAWKKETGREVVTKKKGNKLLIVYLDSLNTLDKTSATHGDTK